MRRVPEVSTLGEIVRITSTAPEGLCELQLLEGPLLAATAVDEWAIRQWKRPAIRLRTCLFAPEPLIWSESGLKMGAKWRWHMRLPK